MQQRTSLCRALIHEPELLMLDEPFGALDAFTREELWCVIRDLHAARKITIVLVTHDLREAVFLADRIFVMSARPGPHARRARGRHPAPARPRGDLHAAIHRHRARVARAHREGAAMKTSLAIRLAPWIATVALFVVWEAAVRDLQDPDILPAAADRSCSRRSSTTGRRSTSIRCSRSPRTLVGFALAVGFGLLLGLAVGWSRAIYAGLYPLMIGFNAIPKVAVVPILVLWFGIGFVPAVLTAFLISFFPIVVNVATGLATIEPELEDVLKALGASKLDIMRKVGIPRALPYFFGSLKVAITLAFVGAVISESVASNVGIGNLMLQAQAQFQVPLIFAGLLALAVEGIVMYALMAMLEARMTGWAQRSGFAQGLTNSAVLTAVARARDRGSRHPAASPTAAAIMSASSLDVGAVEAFAQMDAAIDVRHRRAAAARLEHLQARLDQATPRPAGDAEPCRRGLDQAGEAPRPHRRSGSPGRHARAPTR